MLAIQIKASGKPAEKAKEGICAVLCGEELSYMVDVYQINSEAAKKPTEGMMLHRAECVRRIIGKYSDNFYSE